MPSLMQLQSISVLEAAAASRFGIVIAVEDLTSMTANFLQRAKQELYRIRNEHSPAFDEIQIRIAGENELWLIKKPTPKGSN